MAKDWDKLEASFKKLQPQIKKIDPSRADKLVKAVKAALQTAWDAEEKFREALKAAQKSGIKGKKPKDFAADAEFKTAYGILSKTAGQHGDVVKALQAVSDEAGTLHKTLVRMAGEVKKLITKGNKEQARFQTLVSEAEAKVKPVANAMGKLTAPEMFYGAQFDRVVDGIINKSKKSGASGPAGDAAKLIEQKERDKNLKAAVKMSQQVAQLCEGALKKADSDPGAAAPYLKKAAELIEKLKAFDAAYQKVKKKNTDLIKASKDKAKIVKAIATMAKAHAIAARKYSDALNQVKQKAA